MNFLYIITIKDFWIPYVTNKVWIVLEKPEGPHIQILLKTIVLKDTKSCPSWGVTSSLCVIIISLNTFLEIFSCSFLRRLRKIESFSDLKETYKVNWKFTNSSLCCHIRYKRSRKGTKPVPPANAR